VSASLSLDLIVVNLMLWRSQWTARFIVLYLQHQANDMPVSTRCATPRFIRQFHRNSG
jgi:hypothetical protein